MILNSDALVLASNTLDFFMMFVAIRESRRWPYVFALLTWPGTVAHELLHFMVGLLSGAQPVGLSVIPKRQTDGTWHLGEVSFARLRWWNSVPVSLAPLGLIPIGVWLFFHSADLQLLSAEGAICKIIAVQCLLSGWPSRQDWSHALKGLLTIALFAAAIGIGLSGIGLIKFSMPASSITPVNFVGKQS